MGDPVFASKLSKLISEQVMYGKQLTPIEHANWPSQETPSSTDQQNVTTGETTPIDQSTEIEKPENAGNVGGLNPEAMGEVASLLISIGYILSKEGIVPDKFDIKGVLSFLSGNVNSVPTPTQETPPEGNSNVCHDGGISMDELQPYMEARKLLESKFKK